MEFLLQYYFGIATRQQLPATLPVSSRVAVRTLGRTIGRVFGRGVALHDELGVVFG